MIKNVSGLNFTNLFWYLMTFTKFVQIGRVASINYGPSEGKLVTILDVVNSLRVLVEGENVER